MRFQLATALMDRSIALLVIGLVFGGGIGFVVAASSGITLDGHDHHDPSHHEQRVGVGRDAVESSRHAHGHAEPLTLPAGQRAPTLQIAVQPDPVSGWNLHIKTTNFRFSPESASLAHVPGEGHAHIYVNGTKIARHYGSWMHIASLPKGNNTLKVTLNSNDHRPLAVNQEPLEASLRVHAE